MPLLSDEAEESDMTKLLPNAIIVKWTHNLHSNQIKSNAQFCKCAFILSCNIYRSRQFIVFLLYLISPVFATFVAWTNGFLHQTH